MYEDRICFKIPPANTWSASWTCSVSFASSISVRKWYIYIL